MIEYNFFIALLFGHLVGDYIFQPDWIALNKRANLGIACIHGILYTLSILLFTLPFLGELRPFVIWILFFVFLSHVLIDHLGIANYWKSFLDSTNLYSFKCSPIPTEKDILTGAFTALTYTLTDNTFHLLIMYFSALWLLR